MCISPQTLLYVFSTVSLYKSTKIGDKLITHVQREVPIRSSTRGCKDQAYLGRVPIHKEVEEIFAMWMILEQPSSQKS